MIVFGTSVITPIPLLLLFCFSREISAQSTSRGPELPGFLGREITITRPEMEGRPGDGPPFPKGPASVCVESPPSQQCYTAPTFENFPFGNSAAATVVLLEKDLPAILFSAATGGVSGWKIHLALLKPGTGSILEQLFVPPISVSDQSQYAFWSDFAISPAQIFVTADAVWGPDEGHFGDHRYMISAYVLAPSSMELHYYYLQDRYMTVHRYRSETNIEVLTPEKEEILARLRRIR
jgi:hypothetical protein